jgi:hypothetical protein
MYFLTAKVSLAVTAEQINGKNFLIRKLRIGVIAESLAVETQRGLIDITDIYKPISFNFFSLEIIIRKQLKLLF